MENYIISYDVGTTGIKTCIFKLNDTIELIAGKVKDYPLYVTENGGIEQDPDDWWNAMCESTKAVLEISCISTNEIIGVSFCAQMQGLVLVDKDGNPVRRAMSYLDSRATKQHYEGIGKGIKLAGMNAYKLFKSMIITGAVAASVKDPVWKYKWVQENEPENFKRVYKWLDIKEFLICRATGKFVMTQDSAFATMLFDIRDGKRCFSREICELHGVNIEHMPNIVKSIDMVGVISKNAAKKLGLNEGTPVFGGGGDASLIGIGAGYVDINSTHIYMGTSGWVSTVVKNRKLDIIHMIASIVGANEKTYNYFAELETAGKCLEWVKNHLALDEIDMYIKKIGIHESMEENYKDLYDYMMEAVKNIPPGSNGVIFTPWLHGNRCPFEDHNARGMFFNISIETGKTELIHSVLEGICYHFRWQLESSERMIKTSKTIRFVGGGALAPLTCQILSNVLNREIETVENSQNVGAIGAAVVVAVGLGKIPCIMEANKIIKAKDKYFPDSEAVKTYNVFFEIFKTLYRKNKKSFKIINNR